MTGVQANTELRKPTGAIHSSHRFSLVQSKAINVLLKNAIHELDKSATHVISLAELKRDIGYTSRDTKALKELVKELMSTVVEWNILGVDKKHEWVASSILSSVKISGGALEYAYSPHLKHLFKNQYLYAKLDMLVQKTFTKKHALKLWENLVNSLSINNANIAYSEWYSVVDYRRLMGLGEHEHTEFKMLNTRVIKEPIKEINEKSDILAEAEYRREGKRVSHIRFKIERKAASLKPPEIVAANVQAGEAEMATLVAALEEIGFSTTSINKFCQSHPAADLRKALDVVRANGAKNPQAMFTKALEEAWQLAPENGATLSEEEAILDEAFEADIEDADWRAVRQQFIGQFGVGAFNAWIKPLVFKGFEDNKAVLECDKPFIAKRVGEGYMDVLLKFWQQNNAKVETVSVVSA